MPLLCSPRLLAFPPPRSLAGSGRVAEHQESQCWALIRGYCLCRANSTLPVRQSLSRPPFLLRQEAAGGDVEPHYESLQLGLFCCLPRLISFNYLLPFFFFSSFPNPRFLSSDYFLPLPPAAAGSACLLAITVPSPSPSVSPLLFSTRSSLHAALLAAPPSSLPAWQLFLVPFLHFSHLDGYCLSPSSSRHGFGWVLPLVPALWLGSPTLGWAVPHLPLLFSQAIAQSPTWPCCKALAPSNTQPSLGSPVELLPAPPPTCQGLPVLLLLLQGGLTASPPSSLFPRT